MYMSNKKSTTKKPAKKSDSKSTTKQSPATTKKGGNTKKATAKMTARETVSTYEPISHHIYFDGYSYRVRASVNGTKYSANFSSKKKAFEYRKSLLNRA
jgi:hypothetical protein